MPNKYPKEHYKPHSAKPYERPKSIFRRIASTLHDMFIPSWLLYEPSGETQSSTNHHVETGVESQQKRNRTDLNETCVDTQYAASEESCSYSCIAEDKKIGRSKNYHSTNKHTSEINPNKSSITLHSDILQDNYILQEKSTVQHEHVINGDDNSENSDGSASTSGCSSLVSSHQERRDPVRDAGLQLSESALEQIKKELAEKQLLRRIEKKDKSVETDSINHDIDRNYKRKQMPRMYKDNVPPSKRARPQPAVASQRPTFSLLNFGAPLLKDSSHSVNKCCHSPFYEGKTMFGGASSLRRQQIVLSTPYQNTKFHNVRLKVKEPSVKNEFDYMSTTAKRILHSLEKTTSPAIPATLRLRGPPVVGIIPTSQSIIEKNLEPRLSSTERTQKETFPVAISKCSNVQSTSSSNTSVISNDKMRGQVHLSPPHSQKLDIDKVSDNVKLPNVVLPVNKLPFFNFNQGSKTSENSTTITTGGNGNEFTFSSPIQYNAPSQIHNSEMHFTFSSPVNKDKETDPVSQSEETEASKKECGLSVKSPSHVSKKLETKEISDLKVPSEKIAEMQKKQKNEIKIVQGFGEKFKPEAGSWECSVCLVRNKESNDKCVSCETPNKRISLASTSQVSNFEGFGDKFKKPAGSWSCPTCMIVNNESILSCEACQTPKPQCCHAAETEKLNTTNMSFGIKYKPPSGSWECDTCFVQNSDDVSKCVACETSRPYHTEVADPKQMFTGFKFGVPEKQSDTTFKFGISPVVTTSVVGTSSGFQFGSNAVTTVESGFKFGTTPIVAKTSGTPEFNETSSSTTTTTGFKFGDTPTNVTNTGGFKFGVSPFNVPSTTVTTAGGFQFGTPSSNVTTTAASTTGGFQFVMSPSSTPNTSVTTANGFQFGIPSSVTTTVSTTGGFQFAASPSSAQSTSVTTTAGGFQFGIPSSNVTTTSSTTDGFQFAMSPPSVPSTSVTTADGLQFGASSSGVPSTSVTTAGGSQSEGSASSISVTTTGFKFGEAPSTTGVSGFQFSMPPSLISSGTAAKLETKTPEVKTSPSIKFGTPVSSIQSFGEIPPASTVTTSSIFGGKSDKNLAFTTNGQVELGTSSKINTSNPSSTASIFGQSPTVPVTKDEPNNFKFGFQSTSLESKKPNDKKTEMPGFLISTTTAIVQPSASLVPPASVISTSCTTPIFTFGKPQPVATTVSETFLQNKTKGEGNILSKPNAGDFQFNFSSPQKSSNVTKPLFGLSQNPGSVEAVPSKMGSKFGTPTTVGISPVSTTSLFTFGSGALGSSSGISNNFPIPSSSTFSFGSSKPAITTTQDPAIHSTCSNTFSTGTSAPQVSFSNFGSKLSTPVFGQNINQPKQGGFGFQPSQNLQFNAATSSNVFRFGMPSEQKPGDDVKSGFSFNTSQEQEPKASTIQAQKSSFNFTPNNETAKSKPAINFFTPKTTPVFGMPSTSTVVGTTPTFNFTGNASTPPSAAPFSFTATPSSASNSPVQRKIKRAVRRSGVGGRRD